MNQYEQQTTCAFESLLRYSVLTLMPHSRSSIWSQDPDRVEEHDLVSGCFGL